MNSPKKTWLGFTLANVLAITEPVHLKSLWTSLKMAFLTTLICFILAYPLGLVLCSLNLKKSNFIIFLFILPMWMNFLLRTMAWQLILSNNGVLNLGAGYFTILRKIIFPLSLPGVISGITMVFVPSMTSFVISNILGGSNTLLIGNIIEQEFTYNFNWNLGSGLSFVLLVFTLISMGLMSVFDKSEGGTNIW